MSFREFSFIFNRSSTFSREKSRCDLVSLVGMGWVILEIFFPVRSKLASQNVVGRNGVGNSLNFNFGFMFLLQSVSEFFSFLI